MSKLTDDLDPRLLILPVEASYKDLRQRDPINGVLILSTVGFHFYGQRFDASHKTFVDIAPEHIALPDVEFATSMWTSAPVIQATIYSLFPRPEKRIYNIGFTKTIGRGRLGEMAAGIGNLSKRISTGDKRADFIAAVEEVKKKAPSFEQNPQSSNPHLVRFRYFAKASAFGPAMAFADRAQIALPENREVKRERAWLLLHGQRYRQLVEESQKKSVQDAEVMIIYGLAHMITGNRDKALSLFEQARQLEPGNATVQTATAWNMAMQGKNADAQAQINLLRDSGVNDQQTRLLMGCACECIGDHSAAIEHYMASASLTKGYIEGGMVTRRVLSLANALNATAGLRIMQQFVQSIPEQRDAWKGLALAAKRASDETAAQQAQERLSAMESPVF